MARQGDILSVRLSGDKRLRRAFRALGVATEQRIARKAVTFALTPVVKAIRRTAPRGPTGLLRFSVNKRVKRYRRRGVAVGIVGHRTKLKGRVRGRLESPTFYAHIVEGGSKGHRIPRRGSRTMPIGGGFARVVQHPGTTGQQYMLTAWRSTRGAVAARYQVKLWREIEKETLKLRAGA